MRLAYIVSWTIILIALYFLLPIREEVNSGFTAELERERRYHEDTLAYEGFEDMNVGESKPADTVLDEILDPVKKEKSMLKSFNEAAKMERSITKQVDEIQKMIDTYFPTVTKKSL
jgi:hypothetical protein